MRNAFKVSALLFCLCMFIMPAHGGEFFGWNKAKTNYSDKLTIETHDGKKHDFMVELAVTPQQQETGLMNRQSMAANQGMLFEFDDNTQRSFWMKNTLIPLDLLFITETGVIHHIHHDAKPLDLTAIPSYGRSKAVLEIYGGVAEKLDIPEGSRIIHPFFKAE